MKNKINRYLTNTVAQKSQHGFLVDLCVCVMVICFGFFLVRCPVSVLAIFEIQSKEACG